MFDIPMAKLTSAMVTANAAELVVEVTLHLQGTADEYKLVPAHLHHLQSTASLDAIKQMHWHFSLQPEWFNVADQKATFTPEGWEKALAYYQECTRALFKRRPWIPDQKPYLDNKLVATGGDCKSKWRTTRRISTHTEAANAPPVPEAPMPHSAPDD